MDLSKKKNSNVKLHSKLTVDMPVYWSTVLNRKVTAKPDKDQIYLPGVSRGVAIYFYGITAVGTRPNFFVRSRRIRVNLLSYENKSTDKRQQNDWRAKKNLDGQGSD